jgi:ABC-2 type transport system permease protein
MNAFIVFTKKELTESLRTNRFVIMLVVFVLLGIMNPLFAKLMPDIIGSIDMDGIELTVPEPTAMDSWGQFYSNVGQMGLLTLIIIYSGIMASEFTHGTLLNLLTKGLGRGTVIYAKFTAATLIWTLAYLVCLGVTAVYTAFYWEIDVHNAFFAFGGMWLYGELMIALLIFGGTVFSTFYGSLALAGGEIIVLSIANIWPEVKKFNPISLAGETLPLLSAEKTVGDFVPAAIVCAACVAALLVASSWAFRRKQM